MGARGGEEGGANFRAPENRGGFQNCCKGMHGESLQANGEICRRAQRGDERRLWQLSPVGPPPDPQSSRIPHPTMMEHDPMVNQNQATPCSEVLSW